MWNANTVIAVKVLGFWVFFWLVLAGFRSLYLPGLGSAAAPVSAILLSAVTLLAILVLLRREGGSVRDIGLRVDRRSPLHAVIGFCLGAVVVGAMIGVLILLTPLQAERSASIEVAGLLAVSFLILLPLALMEALAFRTYSLFRLQEAWGIRPAIYLSAIAFAFYHGWALDNLLGPGVWGILFAWMALSTRSIVLPTAFHLGLNWAQALLGMKPKYTQGVWDLSLADSGGIMGADQMGLLMQLLILAGLLVGTLRLR